MIPNEAAVSKKDAVQVYVKRGMPSQGGGEIAENAVKAEAAPLLWKTEPMVRPYCTGSASKVNTVAKFQNDKYAALNLAPTQARHTWWMRRAASCGVQSYPLTVEKIDLAGALLKAGQYRSAA